MFPVLRKYTVPLALLLAVLFFGGATLAPAVLAGQTQAEQCCNEENVPEVPVEDEGCFDCYCPTCHFVIKTQFDDIEPLAFTTSVYSWLVSNLAPSEFIRSIDYPPEHA